MKGIPLFELFSYYTANIELKKTNSSLKYSIKCDHI